MALPPALIVGPMAVPPEETISLPPLSTVSPLATPPARTSTTTPG